MKILLTGGLGYIGSHTAVCLLEEGFEVVIVDNLSNSERSVREKIEEITGKKVKLYVFDLRNSRKLERVFARENFDVVIHFAGLKAVGESVAKPIEYYDNNIMSTLAVLSCMKKFGCKKLIFSSSATVYGRAQSMPIYENFPTSATNPYGRTKLFIEEILKDVFASDPSMNIIMLRYFNPIGAHKSGLIGENPNGIPNNLLPYVTRVSLGELDVLSIFGNDYDTKDGTGVRDYIHVMDLAEGHVAAAKKLDGAGLAVYNLGTGVGYSVLDIVDAYNRVCGGKVKYKFAPRRPGDVDVCFASPEKAEKELGFKAKRSLVDMCEDSFRFGLNISREKSDRKKR